MAEQGAAVVFTGRTEAAGRVNEERMRARGLAVTYCHADNSQEDDVRRAVQTVVDTYGTITTVVNNAMEHRPAFGSDPVRGQREPSDRAVGGVVSWWHDEEHDGTSPGRARRRRRDAGADG